MTWNRTNLHTLQTTAKTVSEKTVQDVQVTLSYAKTGLRLLGLRRLNNNVRLNLTASLGTDLTYNARSIEADLTALLRGNPLTETTPIENRRIQLSPRISYTVSNQVTADVFVRYERSIPRGGVNLPTSSFDGGVSLRILFSN